MSDASSDIAVTDDECFRTITYIFLDELFHALICISIFVYYMTDPYNLLFYSVMPLVFCPTVNVFPSSYGMMSSQRKLWSPA